MLDIIIACDRREVDFAFWLNNASLLFRSTPIQSLILVELTAVTQLKRSLIVEQGFTSHFYRIKPDLLQHNLTTRETGKAALLLSGFCFSTEQFIFFLDSDIRIPFGLIGLFLTKALSSPSSAFYIGAVYEVSGFSPYTVYQGYKPSLQNTFDSIHIRHIEIIPWRSLGHRPGFGNILVPRTCYLAAGRHDSRYIHYGWEDHDLIISLLLMNVTVSPLGYAFHRTHADDTRLLRSGSRSDDVSKSLQYFCAKYCSLLSRE